MIEVEHKFEYNGNEYLAHAMLRDGRITHTNLYLSSWSTLDPYNKPNSIPARIAEAFFSGIEAKEQAQ